MADFLGGLLSGGGGLYDDLLTPQQQSQLSSRGLLSMAGAFADAAMPSRFPVPLGAAIGKAAAAMSGGRDEAALKLLQGQKLAQEVQTMKATSALQQQFMKDIQTLPLDVLFKRYNIGAGGGVPGAAPAAPTTTPLPPAASALPTAPGAPPADFGAAGEYGGGQAPTGLLGLAPSLPPSDVPPAGPPMKASSLGAPDTVLPSGPSGLLTTPATYGGGAGTSPFGPGGEEAPTVRLAASSGSPSDPRGLIPYIRERATALGIDPDVAVRVAQSEGLGTFRSSVIQRNGQREPSFGAFQLYTGGGMGNDFQRDTGLDPSDPKNERATIDYALNKALSTGWTPWHGTAGAGIGPRTGLPGGPDYVIPSGRGMPANMLQQVADKGGAPGAPAAAGGEGMNTLLLELAKRNAMAEILKLGNPYSSMLNVLQGSPAYKGQIAGEEERAKQPFALERQRSQSELDTARDLIGKGVARMPDGSIVPIPNAAAAFAAIDNMKQTGDIKEYLAYAGQTKDAGQIPLPYEKWDLQRRRAAATSINTAEGIEAAQMKARMAVDQKVASDAADKALAAQQLMPLLDEALHLARTTPGGLAGPVSQKFAGVAAALGIAVPQGASNAEALGSINQQLIPLVRQPGAQSNAEMDAYLRAGPGLMLSQDGRVKIAEMTKAMSQRAIEVARVYRANIGAPDLYEKLAALDKPLFTAEQRAAMEAAANAPAAAAPQGAPVAPGTFQTPHGTVTRVPN